MIPASLPHDETERLIALHRLQILDTAPEDSFERVTTLAAQIFGVPIAVISLVDANRQWFKSCYGLDATQTDRKVAFCAHAILANETLVIPDARLDPRFVDNPLVTGGPQIRFYAGAVLRDRDEYNLGTLCLIDHCPRTFTNEQQSQLENLAAIAMNQMELRLGAESPSVVASLCCEPDCMVFEVCDQGIGIPPDDIHAVSRTPCHTSCSPR